MRSSCAGLTRASIALARVLRKDAKLLGRLDGPPGSGCPSAPCEGAAQSWIMLKRYLTMNVCKFDFGFAVYLILKDLSFCIAESRRNGANLPVTALVDQFYSEVEKMGGKRWDTSSLLARLQR